MERKVITWELIIKKAWLNGSLPTSWDIAGHETKRKAQKNEQSNTWT